MIESTVKSYFGHWDDKKPDETPANEEEEPSEENEPPEADEEPQTPLTTSPC